MLFNTRVRIKSTATVLTAETEGLLDHEVCFNMLKVYGNEMCPDCMESSRRYNFRLSPAIGKCLRKKRVDSDIMVA